MALSKNSDLNLQKVVIIGQGYVGLPLAMRCVEVGYKVIGYDTDDSKIQALKASASPIDDITNEQVASALSSNSYLPTSEQGDLKDFEIAVITVPTPLRDDRPDTSFIELAGSTIAKHLRSGSLVVLESTSYPGTTEEILRPILEKGSGLTCGHDFSLGFSLGSYEQSLARIHRPGQTRPVEYIHLLAQGTVDEKVMAALAHRADVVNSVLQQLKGQS